MHGYGQLIVLHIDQFKLCCKFIIPECSNHKSTMYMFKGNIIILIHTLPTLPLIPLIRSATSIRQLGHHVVSTVECHLLHPDCCCIRVEMVDQGLS